MDPRWYVHADGTPVTWEEAVQDGHATVDIFAATCTPGLAHPWVVLWCTRGTRVPPEQVAWARSRTQPGPVPPLRRTPPRDTVPPAALLRGLRAVGQ